VGVHFQAYSIFKRRNREDGSTSLFVLYPQQSGRIRGGPESCVESLFFSHYILALPRMVKFPNLKTNPTYYDQSFKVRSNLERGFCRRAAPIRSNGNTVSAERDFCGGSNSSFYIK
jgi:hypothetical protein